MSKSSGAGRLVQVHAAVLDVHDVHGLRDAAGGHLGAGRALPSTPTVCGSGANELLKGWQFTPQTVSDTITGKDFGNVAAVTCSPDGTIPSPPWLDYDVNIPPSSCSTGGSKRTPGSSSTRESRTARRTSDVWTGDSQGATVPLLEHINFPDALNADGTLKYTHLVYTDAFPFTGGPQTMPSCKVDPREPADHTKLASRRLQNPAARTCFRQERRHA